MAGMRKLFTFICYLKWIKGKLVLFLFGLGEKPSRCHRCQAQSKPVYRGPHNSTIKFTAGKDIDHAGWFDK